MPHLANWLLHSGHWQVYGFSPEQDFTVSIRNTGASTRTRKLSNFAPDLIRTTLCHHTAIILAKSNLIKPFLKSSQCQFLQHVSIWRAQVEQCFPVQSNAKSLSFYPTILILFITTAWAIFWSSFPNTISPNSLQSSFFSTILQEHDHKLQDSCSSFSYMFNVHCSCTVFWCRSWVIKKLSIFHVTLRHQSQSQCIFHHSLHLFSASLPFLLW